MEEIDSLWSYQETMDEMRQKLLYTNLELERCKMESSEEKRKNNQLIQLIKIAYQERDEATNHLQKLLDKVNQSQLNKIVDYPLITNLPKANSSTIESNSLSETYNYQSSSPVESFLDVVSSPELSNTINVFDYPSLVDTTSIVVHQQVSEVDYVIENLIKGKTLPQQGKFLQTVLEAGPLLQTLLVAGPLPRWRNPPQFKSLHIPPVSIKGCESNMIAQNTTSLNCQPYFEMSCASSQMLSPYLGYHQKLVSGGPNCNNFVHIDKRQRLQ